MTQPWGSVELDPAHCRALLGSAGTGRVAVSTALGPQVAPVGYAVVNESIVVWTSPFSVVARCAPGTFVAFEVDSIDAETREGWYVQARGRAELLSDPEVTQQLVTRLPRQQNPWQQRTRHCIVIRWSELSGQGVGSRWQEAAANGVAGHAAV